MNNIEQKTENLSQNLKDWLEKHFGNKDITQYKNLALSLIFYKFLSDQFERFANQNLAGEAEYSKLDESEHADYITALKGEGQSSLGYFLCTRQK